jgi:hypothetical protein
MSEIKWQEPPTFNRGTNGKWDGIRAELQARPGEWALVAEKVSASAATVQSRPGFEFVSRRKPEYPLGRADIYARYVGES